MEGLGMRLAKKVTYKPHASTIQPHSPMPRLGGKLGHETGAIPAQVGGSPAVICRSPRSGWTPSGSGSTAAPSTSPCNDVIDITHQGSICSTCMYGEL